MWTNAFRSEAESGPLVSVGLVLAIGMLEDGYRNVLRSDTGSAGIEIDEDWKTTKKGHFPFDLELVCIHVIYRQLTEVVID